MDDVFISEGFALSICRAGHESGTTPYAVRFRLNPPRFDASAQHTALARPPRNNDFKFYPNCVEFSFLCTSVCGEVASCFGSYKRPIRMSTTVYIKSYRRHSFLVHLDFLEFKDFTLSVWVFWALNFSIRRRGLVSSRCQTVNSTRTYAKHVCVYKENCYFFISFREGLTFPVSLGGWEKDSKVVYPIT